VIGAHQLEAHVVADAVLRLVEAQGRDPAPPPHLRLDVIKNPGTNPDVTLKSWY